MTLLKKAVSVALLAAFTAGAAFAQCEGKTGFAKQVCQAQANNAGAALSGAGATALGAFKGAPLTTSLSDAVHLGTWEPEIEPKAFAPLLKLERTDDGAFILKTGIYEAYLESYSLEPYDNNWGRPAAFFPAPIKGRRAKVISDILKYTELHPDVAQAYIQNLLGLTVFGTDLEKMPVPTQQAAAHILPRESLLLLKGAAQAKAIERIILGGLGRRAPTGAQQVAEAIAKAKQIDQQYGITTTASQLKTSDESTAFVAGSARGTWAQMPGGFYLRYLPEGYAKIRVQVIVPDAAMEGADPKKPLTFDPTQYLAVHAGTPAQRLGISLRPVGGR
jgi:hypothetical protein